MASKSPILWVSVSFTLVLQSQNSTYGCSQEANSGPNLVCSASAVLSFGGKQSEVLTGEVFHNEKSKRPNAIGGFRKWWYPKMDGLFYNGKSY